MIQDLITDLTTNSLFITFAISEVIIFITGLFFIVKGYRQSSSISIIGDELKKYFKKVEIVETEEKIALPSMNRLTNSILDVVRQSQEEEFGIEREQIERMLRFEFEKPYSVSRMLINILPIIGLIGTFLGIAIAVYQLKFSSDISQIAKSIESNLDALNPFIIGIRFAFFSTILALILALFLRIILEISFVRSKNIIQNFQNFFTTDLSRYIKPRGEAEKIAKSVSNFSRRVSRLSGEIEKSLDKLIDNFVKQSIEQRQLFDKSIQSLKNLEGSMLTNLEKLWKNISDTLTDLTDQIFKATNNFTQASDDAVLLLGKIEDLEKRSSEVTSNQIENTNKIGQAVRKLTEDSERISKEIEGLLTPIKDVRDKYERVLQKSLELNKPIEDTNRELKLRFENLIELVGEIQNKNYALFEKVQLYANSLESTLGGKLDNILEKENKVQSLVNSTYEIQKQFEAAISKLNSYSSDLNNASTILVQNIKGELNNLFTNISQRQDIQINISNPKGDRENHEKLLVFQNKTLQEISNILDDLDHTLAALSEQINPPFFSLRRWFGNGRNKSNRLIKRND